MKKKFDLKLTACVVSLFIGFLVLILLNQHKAGLFCGFILLAVGLYFFSRVHADKTNRIILEALDEVDKLIDETDKPDEEVINEVYSEIKKLKKQRKSMLFTFSACAILLVIVAFISLF